jgi:hypothetical protein
MFWTGGGTSLWFYFVKSAIFRTYILKNQTKREKEQNAVRLVRILLFLLARVDFRETLKKRGTAKEEKQHDVRQYSVRGERRNPVFDPESAGSPQRA